MSTYGFTPYDPGAPGGISVRGGGHPVLGRTRGQTFPMHNKAWDKTEDDEDLDDEDLDDFVDVVVRKKIRKNTDSNSMYRNDLGNRRDVGNSVTNVGGYLTMEFAGDHTTIAAKGLSPRLTYRTKNNTKGPSMSGMGNSRYVRNMPGRQDGTLDGWSHAPRPKAHEDDYNIWSLKDIDPHDRALKRQNRIRNYIQSLEYN